MLAPLLDHLTAIVVGTVILLTLLILQTRQQQTAVDETVHSSVWEHVHQAVELIRNDTANMLNHEQAEDAFPNPSNAAFAYRLEVDTTAEGLTHSFLFPALVRDTVGASLSEAQVAYRLVPHTDPVTDSTLTVVLNGAVRDLYKLQRAVLKTTDMTTTSVPADALYDDITAGVLVDFEIGLVGAPLDPVRVGGPPNGFSAVRIAATGSLDRLSQISTDQANTRETNGVRVTATARPVNL